MNREDFLRLNVDDQAEVLAEEMTEEAWRNLHGYATVESSFTDVDLIPFKASFGEIILTLVHYQVRYNRIFRTLEWRDRPVKIVPDNFTVGNPLVTRLSQSEDSAKKLIRELDKDSMGWLIPTTPPFCDEFHYRRASGSLIITIHRNIGMDNGTYTFLRCGNCTLKVAKGFLHITTGGYQWVEDSNGLIREYDAQRASRVSC